jgi:predicted MFS family arabinose efflux permease
MTAMNSSSIAQPMPADLHRAAVLLRSIVIGLTAFLTLVDLFAAQAILPSLTRLYQVSPAAMGFAVNASTIGMAVSGLAVAFVSQRIDRRKGILFSLTLLAIPTALLAVAPDLTTFTALRIAQGVFMAAAFALMLAYLGENCSAADAGGALAAYVTGNVASNLFGRLLSSALADHLGVAANFYVFAVLNLTGALLVYFTLASTPPMATTEPAARSPWVAWARHLGNPLLRRAFAIGFCILFAFIGTFTYVNFVLVRDPIAISQMSLGFVYFVFFPAFFTTPIAGGVAQRLGARPTFWGALAVTGLGLPLLLVGQLVSVMIGLALVGAGAFFAQAAATGFVSHVATTDRGAASGIYLASYYLGGIVGSAVLGQVFMRYGWGGTVAGIALSLVAAALLAVGLGMPQEKRMSPKAS